VIPLRRATGFLLAGVIVPAALVSAGCQRQSEPPRPVPSGWRIWRQDGLSFRFPPQYTVTTEDFHMGELRVFISDSQDSERLVLRLVFGNGLFLPPRHPAGPLPGKPVLVRINGHPAERYGPGKGPGGAFSEGQMELAGKGRFANVHFSYANLDPGRQKSAETITASILADD
jgi:hypothetical protein